MQNVLSRALKGFSCAKASLSALVFSLLAVSSFAATDYSAMTDGVATDISGLGTVLMGIAAAIIGIALIVFLFRFIRGVLH